MKKIKIFHYAAAVLLMSGLLFFSQARVFDDFEYSTVDLRYRLRPPQEVDKDIVIIQISDDSIASIGEWPFPRNYHALLIQALSSAGAKSIVFDVFFSEGKKNDEALARAADKAGNVYMPYVFDLDRGENPEKIPVATAYAADLIPVFREAVKNTGYINVILDRDGKVRRVPVFIRYKGELYPHLAFRVALNDLGYTVDDTVLHENSRIDVAGEFKIPLGIYSSMMVNYPDSWGRAFRHYSYLAVIQSYLADVTGQEPSIDLSELKDAVCFVGFTATASPDAHPSPLHSQYPGIGVHTSVYNSIMNRSFLRRLGRWWNLLILVLLWGVTAYITHRASRRYAIISMISFIVAFSLIAFILFWPFGVWIDMFYPLVTMLGLYVAITFRKYIAETQKREIIEKELNIARDIQRSFLPTEISHSEALEICVSMNTARQVGGDLYDIVELSKDKTAVMLGDVSGKGVPAALYMAKAVSVFKTFVRDDEPADILTRINERLISESASNLFVTMVCTIFDTASRTVTYAIGGHLPTILVRPSGEVELLDVEEGMPLGMLESGFSPGKAAYEPGSLFLFYSDGVTEAMNAKDEMFGQERLVRLAGTFSGVSSAEVVKCVQEAVDEFAGKAPQHDDITVLAVRV